MSKEIGVFGRYAGPLVRVVTLLGGRSFYRLSIFEHEVRVFDRPPAHGGGWVITAGRPGRPDREELEIMAHTSLADPSEALDRVAGVLLARNKAARAARAQRRAEARR